MFIQASENKLVRFVTFYLYSINEAGDSDTIQPVSDETAVDDIDVNDIVTDSAVENDSNMDDTDVDEQPLLVPEPNIRAAVQDYKKPIGPSGNHFKACTVHSGKLAQIWLFAWNSGS